MPKATLQSIPVSQGEIIDLEINSMAYDNSAVARYKDFVILIDRGAPGDYVTCQITTVRPNYARAKILEIKKCDQSYRIEPSCKLFKACGGCQWQHLSYEKQLEQKDLILQNIFSKQNLKPDVLKNILGAKNPWSYRNKVQYPVRTVPSTGRLKAGYFEWHTNELINIKHCLIQHTLFDDIVETIRVLAEKYKITAYDSKNKTGWLRHICVRIGFNTGEALLTLVAVNENLSKSQDFANEVIDRHPELLGVCINANNKSTNVIYGEKTKVIRGKGYIFEKINNLKLKISATSFFQVNTIQATKLLEILTNYANLNRSEIVLDAYCGVGLIALSLASKANKIIGIEEIKQSVDDAIFSVKENNIKNIRFITGKVENKIKEVLDTEGPQMVILDPPRSGCSKKVLASISNANCVKKMIYVSCNPATLVRDLEILQSNNFNVKSVQPIDLFPHTYHIESVVLLEK